MLVSESSELSLFLLGVLGVKLPVKVMVLKVKTSKVLELFVLCKESELFELSLF